MVGSSHWAPNQFEHLAVSNPYCKKVEKLVVKNCAGPRERSIQH